MMETDSDANSYDRNNGGELEPQVADYVASAVKGALGMVPFAGSLLGELVGFVIPNQRVDRIVKYAYALEEKLSHLEQEFVKSQLANENFSDLMEEGLRQAARALGDERRQYIASIIAHSLSSEDIEYYESKHLLKILGEINDVEVIWLRSFLVRTMGGDEEFRSIHEAILTPVRAYMGSPTHVLDKATLQDSYQAHLVQLGLLQPRYLVDNKTKLPEFDERTGEQRIWYHDLTALGQLLLREIGLTIDEDDA